MKKLGRPAAGLAMVVLGGCPNSVLPVPPPQPSLTHGFAAETVGTVTPSVQASGGYAELGRGTLGVSYSAHPAVALGGELSASGPFGQVYGRPSLAFTLSENVRLLLGGTLGGFPGDVYAEHSLWMGGDLGFRFGGTVSERKVQLWLGVLGGYTAPLTNLPRTVTVTMGSPPTTRTFLSGLTSTWHAGGELGVLGPVVPGSPVELGFLAYGAALGGIHPAAFGGLFDVGGLLAVRLRLEPLPSVAQR